MGGGGTQDPEMDVPQWICRECVEESGCELCGNEREDQNIGCCEGTKDGGRCSKSVEKICSNCAVWDEDASEWRCPECADCEDDE